MPQPSETVEGRLADLIEAPATQVLINSCGVSCEDRMIIVKALRDRARWMAADIKSGEKGQRRVR